MRCHAFGLALELRDGIEIDALETGAEGGVLPPTRVRHAEPDLIEREWPARTAKTTRELRADGTLVFSVAGGGRAGYLLTMPARGRFLVSRDGTDIVCEPAPGAAEWSEALMIHALPLACTLRGLEPFHSSAVAIDGRALMLTGIVTSGKSSLAARLVDGGADLLSDDVVAVDGPHGELRAHPAGRWLRLRTLDAELGPRLRAAGRRGGRLLLAAPVASGPRPLGAVYVLGRGSGTADPIAPMAPSGTALLAATYNLSVHEPARLMRQLDLVHRLAVDVPLFRVAVSPALDEASLAAAIRRHFDAL